MIPCYKCGELRHLDRDARFVCNGCERKPRDCDCPPVEGWEPWVDLDPADGATEIMP